jgi:hypothetical protein
MDSRRLRFAAALLVFLAWVGALATLAIRSSRPPVVQSRPLIPPR